MSSNLAFIGLAFVLVVLNWFLGLCIPPTPAGQSCPTKRRTDREEQTRHNCKGIMPEAQLIADKPS